MGLPPLLGPLRRRRRLRHDIASSTWEAWNTQTAERVLLRVPLPGSRLADALKSTSLASPALQVRWSADPRPHLATEAFTCSLADQYPLDDPQRQGLAELRWTAQLALGAFAALAALHDAGQPHGWIGPESVVNVGTRWTLAWLGPPAEPSPPERLTPASAREDIQALGRLVGALDSDGPIGSLAESFVDAPPPSAADAWRLLLGACAELLAREHNALLARARAQGFLSRRGLLAALVARLGVVLPPPVGSGRFKGEGRLFTLVSDGTTVRAAAGAARSADDAPVSPGATFLIWSAAGFETVAARRVLRAWSSACASAEPSPSPALAPLVRWIRATSRLRVDRFLLAR